VASRTIQQKKLPVSWQSGESHARSSAESLYPQKSQPAPVRPNCAGKILVYGTTFRATRGPAEARRDAISALTQTGRAAGLQGPSRIVPLGNPLIGPLRPGRSVRLHGCLPNPMCSLPASCAAASPIVCPLPGIGSLGHVLQACGSQDAHASWFGTLPIFGYHLCKRMVCIFYGIGMHVAIQGYRTRATGCCLSTCNGSR
jgi:hypothetical protein